MFRSLKSGMRRSSWVLVTVVALAIALPAAAVFAHDYSPPYKWDTGVTITVESRMPHSADVHSAADDYDDNTDLAVNRCSPNSNCGNVIHYDGYYGPAEPPAWADPLSQMEPCSDDDHVVNGYCNETNHKVDFSYIYYNTAYNYAPLVSVITLHEMGHVWGLDHTSCSKVSVMKPGPGTCQGSVQYAYLTQHDIDDINAKY